jgi:hypothetical protein
VGIFPRFYNQPTDAAGANDMFPTQPAASLAE